jgi:lysophospholipase L1-like esterase
VIINSIYPVAASYTHLDQINNDKISAANGWLQQVAEDLGVPYLDSESALLGSDGYLPESLQNGDGMHLTAEGFQLVINYLRTHGYQ